MSASLQFLVDFIQQHIGCQRRQGTSLRSSLVPLYHHTVRKDSRVQVATDEPQDPTILNAFRQLSHQHIVVDAIKERFQIDVDHHPASFVDVALRSADGVASTSSWTEAVAVF